MAKKKRLNIKRVGEIMESMDTPRSEYNLTEAFKDNGAGAPSGPSVSQTLLSAFRNSYEAVDSEHFAQEYFTMGRLREYFQAWIVPKMPDPLPAYIDELAYMGFNVRSSFDGTPCIMVRYRGSVQAEAEEVVEEPQELPVYTDDWEDDLSDIEPPFEEEDNTQSDTGNEEDS